LPVATTGALYEAPTPPDDGDGCLQALTTTTAAFTQRLQRVDDASEMFSSSCRRNDNAERFVANSNNNNNNNNTSTAGVTGMGHGGYGVATPVIQMSAKSRYIPVTFFIFRMSFSLYRNAIYIQHFLRTFIYATADEADAYMFYICFFCVFGFLFFFRSPQKYQTTVLGNS